MLFQALEFAVSRTVLYQVRSQVFFSNQISSRAPPGADSPNTRHTTPFSLSMPAVTHIMRWPCYCNSYLLCRIEQRNGNGVQSTLLLQSYV